MGFPQFLSAWALRRKKKREKERKRDCLRRKEIDHGLYDLLTDTKRALKEGPCVFV